MTAACAYPLFRDRFLRGSEGDGGESEAGVPDPAATSERPPGSARGGGGSRAGTARGLAVLDLRSLPRDDGPPSELRARKDKLAFFDRQCTRVAEGLFVGGETVARSRELLAGSGITHVVNCVGFLYPAFFQDELRYKVLFLQDTPGEDILCVLYDVFDFIEDAAGGNVLVHCSQGVSRSTALAIAYLMWKTGRCYDDVFIQVKAHRGVANPNIGFICQLLQWHKRRQGPLERCRVYRVAPQSAAAPRYLVPRAVPSPVPASLDPRGAFVVQTQTVVYMWKGARCPEEFAAAATRFAQQLVKYEGAEGPVVTVSQGREPAAFWECLTAVAGEAAAAGSSSSGSTCSSAPSSPRENSAYDKDFELFSGAPAAPAAAAGVAASSGAGSEPGDSARSGRKTPRDEARDQAHSPNERLRKQARSGTETPVAAAPRAVEDVATSELERGISLDSAAKELEAREQRVAQLPSRLPRHSSEEVSVPSLLLSGLDQESDDDASSSGGSGRGSGRAGSGRGGGGRPQAQAAAAAGAKKPATPAAARPVPPLKLKLPGR